MKVYRGIKRLGNVLEEVTKPSCRQYGFVTYKILANWPHIMGAYLVEHTMPQKIHFERDQTRRGTLIIQVYNPGFALELQAMEGMIVERINTYFGYPAISRIKITISKKRVQRENKVPEMVVSTTPIAKEEHQEINNTIDTVQDEKLKNILSHMARSLFS